MGLDDLGTPARAGMDDADVEDALAAAEPVEDVRSLEAVEDGINVVYRATIETGKGIETVYAKVATTTRRHRFAAEPDALRLVADQTGVPVPEPIWYSDGDDAIGRAWYAMSAEPGQSAAEVAANADTDDLLGLARDAGHILGHLHAETSVDFAGEMAHQLDGELDTLERGDWPNVFTERATSLVGQTDARFADLRNELHDLFSSVNREEVEVGGEYALLHLDYWWENLLATPDDGVTAVIDWGRAVGGDSACGLAVAEFFSFGSADWSGRNVTPQRLREEFRAGHAEWFEQRVGEERWRLYELYARLRALRGFPYWWRDASADRKGEIEDRLRDEVCHLLDGDAITEPPR